jgi:hypothetical protein
LVKKGRSFEQKTVDFLTKMQFEAVDGARDDLKIGNFKPDAIGAKEGVLFIIVCVLAFNDKKHSLLCANRVRLEVSNFQVIPGSVYGLKLHLC